MSELSAKLEEPRCIRSVKFEEEGGFYNIESTGDLKIRFSKSYQGYSIELFHIIRLEMYLKEEETFLSNYHKTDRISSLFLNVHDESTFRLSDLLDVIESSLFKSKKEEEKAAIKILHILIDMDRAVPDLVQFYPVWMSSFNLVKKED